MGVARRLGCPPLPTCRARQARTGWTRSRAPPAEAAPAGRQRTQRCGSSAGCATAPEERARRRRAAHATQEGCFTHWGAPWQGGILAPWPRPAPSMPASARLEHVCGHAVAPQQAHVVRNLGGGAGVARHGDKGGGREGGAQRAQRVPAVDGDAQHLCQWRGLEVCVGVVVVVGGGVCAQGGGGATRCAALAWWQGGSEGGCSCHGGQAGSAAVRITTKHTRLFGNTHPTPRRAPSRSRAASGQRRHRTRPPPHTGACPAEGQGRPGQATATWLGRPAAEPCRRISSWRWHTPASPQPCPDAQHTNAGTPAASNAWIVATCSLACLQPML